MKVPSIGSLSAIGSGGRLGVVVGARPLGAPVDGEQLYELRVKTVDGRGATPQTAHLPATLAAALRQAGEITAGAPEAGQPRLLAAPGGGRRRAPAAARLADELTPAEKEEVARLRQRDAQVRQEEQAHAANAGDLAGPIGYIYRTGPDGRQYAVGGSVQIGAQTVSGTPEEIARIGARFANAALAAHNPSAQDLAAARNGYRLSGEAADLERRGSRVDISA